MNQELSKCCGAQRKLDTSTSGEFWRCSNCNKSFEPQEKEEKKCEHKYPYKDITCKECYDLFFAHQRKVANDALLHDSSDWEKEYREKYACCAKPNEGVSFIRNLIQKEREDVRNKAHIFHQDHLDRMLSQNTIGVRTETIKECIEILNADTRFDGYLYAKNSIDAITKLKENMAVRVRKNGKILCAAMHPEKKGDLYINDSLHYYLSVEKKVLVSEPHKKHKKSGEWWFITDLKDKFLQIL